jgi:hypothetical protein
MRQTRGPFPFYLNAFSDELHDKDEIIKVAEMTGGVAHGSGLFGTSMLEFFKSVLADYRRTYVLQYTPTGAAQEGWHEIAVKVIRPGKYEVRARRGYSVDVAPGRD